MQSGLFQHAHPKQLQRGLRSDLIYVKLAVAILFEYCPRISPKPDCAPY